ncbi:MAG: hypothetical protein ABSG36_15500 [Acidimicrobiales bacterium]
MSTREEERYLSLLSTCLWTLSHGLAIGIENMGWKCENAACPVVTFFEKPEGRFGAD